MRWSFTDAGRRVPFDNKTKRPVLQDLQTVYASRFTKQIKQIKNYSSIKNINT